jgi:hypothetical protein
MDGLKQLQTYSWENEYETGRRTYYEYKVPTTMAGTFRYAIETVVVKGKPGHEALTYGMGALLDDGYHWSIIYRENNAWIDHPDTLLDNVEKSIINGMFLILGW